MAFEPGHSKVGGRQKGTPNKVKKEYLDLVGEWLLEHLQQHLADILLIEDTEKRVSAFERVVDRFVPRTRVEESDESAEAVTVVNKIIFMAPNNAK